MPCIQSITRTQGNSASPSHAQPLECRSVHPLSGSSPLYHPQPLFSPSITLGQEAWLKNGTLKGSHCIPAWVASDQKLCITKELGFMLSYTRTQAAVLILYIPCVKDLYFSMAAHLCAAYLSLLLC